MEINNGNIVCEGCEATLPSHFTPNGLTLCTDCAISFENFLDSLDLDENQYEMINDPDREGLNEEECDDDEDDYRLAEKTSLDDSPEIYFQSMEWLLDDPTSYSHRSLN